VVEIILARRFKSSTTCSTARLMPRRRSMGFMPAATDLQPSPRIARVSTVAVVVPAARGGETLGGPRRADDGFARRHAVFERGGRKHPQHMDVSMTANMTEQGWLCLQQRVLFTSECHMHAYDTAHNLQTVLEAQLSRRKCHMQRTQQ